MAHGDSSQDARPQGGKVLPLRLETRDLPEEGGGETTVLLASKAMRAAHHLASQVAPSDAPVLIMGESGTGKELFARLIHTLSNRAEKPFVPINCGVLGGELFADKFFGHEAGAFTGAMRLQKGSFELAGDGTLFLDEVGEIPPLNQADFLRVLEQRTFRRLGGDRDLPFGARIVAATNRNLPDMVRRGEFRADLYYRLCVVPVSLPPLRQRREDVPHLAAHFLEMFRHRYHSRELALGQKVQDTLADYAWPGNVRELKNLIERLVLVHPGGEIRPEDLPPEMHAFAPAPYRPESGPDRVPLSAPEPGRDTGQAPDPADFEPAAPRERGPGRDLAPATGVSARVPIVGVRGGVSGSVMASPGSGLRSQSAVSRPAPDYAEFADHDPEKDPPGEFSLEAAVRRAEARAILRAFRQAGGSKAQTAELLGIKPRTLRHKVRELGLVLTL